MKSQEINGCLFASKFDRDLDFELLYYFSGNTNASLRLCVNILVKMCQIILHRFSGEKEQ